MRNAPGRLRGPFAVRVLLYGLPGLTSALAAMIALLSVGKITVLLLTLTVAVVVLGFGVPPVVDWLHGRHAARISRVTQTARLDQLLADQATAHMRDHFGPRGRGTLPSSVRSGTYFSGRTRILAELADWIADASVADARARVVTGAPGSGKSAVLGRTIALAGAREGNQRSGTTARGQWGGLISAGVLARGHTVDEVAAALAQSLHIEEGSASGFLSALRESWRPRPATLVVDAIDEAADPQRLIIELLEPLAAAAPRTKVRLLAATRRGVGDSLLRLFGASAVVMDLDSPEYFDSHDVAEYVLRTLTADDDPQVATPYRDRPGLAAAVASAVAASAGDSFLVAQLSALALAAAPQPLDVAVDRWTETLPATVEAAMERYLREVRPGGRWLRDLLMALAWSQGDGLDDAAAWAAFATAIGTGDYSEHDVARLLLSTSAVDLLHQTKHGERTTFRLFHEALAEYLRRESCQYLSPVEVQRRIADAIVAHIPRAQDGAPDWSRADSYARTFLAVHAAAGRVLDALLADAGFLATAEPGRLLAALPTVATARGRRLAQIIQRVGQQLLIAPPGEQACYLEMAARMAGDVPLAEALARAAPERPWSVPWAQWQPLDESLLLGHHDDYVLAVSAVETPAGAIVVSASAWTLRAWALPEGTPVALGLGEVTSPIVATVAFAEAGGTVVLTLLGNGDLIRSATDSTARVQVIAQNRAAAGLWLVSHAGQPAVVTVTSGRIVELLSATDGGHLAPPAISLDGKYVLTAATIGQRILIAMTDGRNADDATEVSVWDLAEGTVLGLPVRLADLVPGKHPVPVWAAAFTEREGKPLLLCASAASGPVFTWDPLQGRRLGESYYGVAALSALITNDGSHELQWWGSTNGNLHVRRGDDGTVSRIAAHDNGIDTLAACRLDGQLAVVTGSRDGAVRVWHPESVPWAGQEQPTTTVLQVLPPAGDSGQSLVAQLLDDGTVSVLDAADGHVVARLLSGDPGAKLTAMAVLPGHGSALLTVDSERRVAVWHASDEKVRPMWQLPESAKFWDIALSDGNPPVLLVAQTDGRVAFFDVHTGRVLGEPVDTKNGDKRYTVCTSSAPAGAMRFFTFDPEPVVVEWTVSPGQPVTSRTLYVPALPDGKPNDAPSAIAFAVLDDEPVIIGVGSYSRIYVWNARDGSLRNSTRLEQAHWMQLLDADATDIAGRPIVLCGGFTCTLATWRLDSHDEHHLWVGSVITQVKSLPGDRVVVAGTRGTMLIQLSGHLPGQPARHHTRAQIPTAG